MSDSSSATGTRWARASRPAASAAGSGCSSHCSRGSAARRSAQAQAVERSQWALASRRRRAWAGSRASSCSSTTRSSLLGCTATFHLNVSLEALAGCRPRARSRLGTASGPAGSSCADGGAANQPGDSRPSASAKAAPRAKATGPGNWSAAKAASSTRRSRVGPRALSASSRSTVGARAAASPQPRAPPGARSCSSQPRLWLINPWAVLNGRGSSRANGRQCSCRAWSPIQIQNPSASPAARPRPLKA